MPLLEVADLHASYGPVQVLRGLDFSVDEGQVVTILGPNGAGKSTTLRALCGMVRTSGKVTFGGRSVLGRRTDKIVKLGVAHVPEGRGTLTSLSVDENLRLGAHTRRDKSGVRADLDRVYGYFPVLRERAALAAAGLSGGEQQMLAVGRALMLRPRLMLLDEPSLGLAPLVTREVFGVLRRLKEEEGVTMLIVEQNANLALGLADVAHVLETGSIVLSGPAAEIKEDERVRRSYLGY